MSDTQNTALLRAATSAHEAGRLEEAKALYRECLQARPHEAEAHHGLGWLLVQQGDWTDALKCFGAALKFKPWEPEYWISQMEALLHMGQLEAVHQVLARARQAGLTAHQAQSFQERLYAKRMDGLAQRVKRSGLTVAQAAAAPKKDILALREVFLARDNETANRLAEKMVERYPLCAFAWRTYGASMRLDQRPNEALEALRIACDLDDATPDVHINLAVGLQSRGRMGEAEDVFRTVLKRHPDSLRATVNLGLLLSARKHPEAEPLLRAAVAANDADPRPAIALGCHLRDAGANHEAEALLEKALLKDPGNLTGIVALAACHVATGRHVEAAALFSRVDALHLDNTNALGIALFVGSHIDSVAPEHLFRMHRRFGEVTEAMVGPAFADHPNDRDPERILRVGFVSGDLRDHALAGFMLPIWKSLNRDAIAIYAYSVSPHKDEVTQSFMREATGWCDASAMGEEILADRIRRDGIDVLVDLSGHTSMNRLGTFARKPAPVQVSWCGYPGTTGLTRMDYFLSDTVFSPPGLLDEQFTEKLLLPRVSGAFGEADDLPPLAPLPAAAGRRFTFGSFNRVSKLTPGTIALWAEVLSASPHTDLCIGAVEEADQSWIRAAFAEHGIDLTRLRFLLRMGKRAYLEAHAEIDLLLDTTPYSGGTTTGFGLWMGVPTLTLAGSTLPGRQSLNILGHCGLDDFIAKDRKAFVASAARWVGRASELAALRAGMRERLRPSSIGQPRLAAEAFEDAVRAVWRRWCEGLPPDTLIVPERP